MKEFRALTLVLCFLFLKNNDELLMAGELSSLTVSE